LDRAGEAEPAIAECHGGKGSRARNAFREALESYQQAVALLNALPESPERDLENWSLGNQSFLCLWSPKGMLPLNNRRYQRADALIEKSGNLTQLRIG